MPMPVFSIWWLFISSLTHNHSETISKCFQNIWTSFPYLFPLFDFARELTTQHWGISTLCHIDIRVARCCSRCEWSSSTRWLPVGALFDQLAALSANKLPWQFLDHQKKHHPGKMMVLRAKKLWDDKTPEFLKWFLGPWNSSGCGSRPLLDAQSSSPLCLSHFQADSVLTNPAEQFSVEVIARKLKVFKIRETLCISKSSGKSIWRQIEEKCFIYSIC